MAADNPTITNPNHSGPTIATTTYVDAEIASLEKRQPELEAEKEKLLKGQFTLQGLDGQTVKVDLSKFIAGLHGMSDVQINAKLYQMLAGTPVYDELANSYRTKDEITRELTLAGIISPEARAKLSGKVVLANHQFNKGVSRFGTAAKVLNSNWLWFGIALVVFFFWGGGWFFYQISGGNIGGVYQNSNPPPAAVTATIMLETSAVNMSNTPKPPLSNNSNQTGKQLVNYQAGNGSYSYIAAIPNDTNQGGDGSSPTPTPPTSTPTPTDQAGRVGQAPSEVGGLNGPHGAFLAPSYLVVKEANINIDVTIDRAIAQEQPVTAPTPTITATTTTTATDDQSQSQAAATNVSVSMTWPRPGQVLHLGAFPGEVGNCIILGTQANLADLRKLQQNDEVKLFDRSGNVFTYRVLAFSPTGQPERVIDLTNPADNWIFGSPNQGQAALTIIVSMPQPQPPISSQASGDNGQNQQAQAATNPPARDDFTTTRKLAYRAILVSYAPNVNPTTTAGAGAGAALNATQVGVDSSVWQTQPIATMPSQAIPAAAATPVIGTSAAAASSSSNPTTTTPAQAQAQITPTPGAGTGDLPGLPDTGLGGGNNATPPKAERGCSARLINNCPKAF